MRARSRSNYHAHKSRILGHTKAVSTFCGTCDSNHCLRKMKLKITLIVLSYVVYGIVVVAEAQDPGEPRCPGDSFTIIHNCYSDCLTLQVGGDTEGCLGCNETCNQSLANNDRQCPDIFDRCTLGCTLSLDPEGRCRICKCEEPDGLYNEMDLNPCKVNATFFAVLRSCNPLCVERRDDGCFMCNRECNDTDMSGGLDECGVQEGEGLERRCKNGSECLLEGILNRCIGIPLDGDACECPVANGDEIDLDESDFYFIEGVRDRLRIFALQFSAEIELPCVNGSYCSNESQCRPIQGPCVDFRNTMDSDVDCDENGNFRPLQCRRMDDGTHTCRCVHPRNGSMVPDTMRTGIRQREDAPDCVSRVFSSCYYQQEGQNFIIRHGENFVDRQNCTRCRCDNGSPTSCRVASRVNCQILNPGETPQNCRRRNIEIPHGTSRMVGKCNLCGCNNGRLTCTDVEECEDVGKEDDEQERRCEMCQDAPQRLVCGRDGRTYLSRCIAINCSGLRDVDVLDGPCSSQPICRLFPCQPGLTCIPLGGRSCLRKEGCTDDERRICVNRTALRCRVFNTGRDGFSTNEDDTVCGSDGNTYQSFCHLIQMAPPNTRISHAGRCDREECRGGQVCGTDGVTYDSVCHLRSQSANAQVDYRGECVERGDSRPWELCRNIRNERMLCGDTEENCSRRVRSRDGCCPICGGITILAIDRDALDEYSRATDSDTNLDAFMARMTRGDVIPSDVRRRCTVEVSHVRNSTQTNIEVKIIAKNKSADSDFCHNGSLTFTEKINNATNNTSGGTAVNTTLPVEVSFARAAVAAPLIEGSDQQGGKGAASVTIPSSSFTYLVCLGAALLATLF